MILEDLKISVSTLSDWFAGRRSVTVLDVRPKSEREEWSIPGSIHADIYSKLKANDPTALDNLNIDKNIPVVTVCAAGKTSLKAAEMLKEQGYEVYSLDGGMKAWNFAWNTAQIILDDVKVIQVRRSSKGCLSYIVGVNGEAIVIDASLDPHVYLDLAEKNGWMIKYVTDTHIHADYLSRTRELAKACGAKHLLIDKADVGYAFIPIKHLDLVRIGNATLEILLTPGHTMESTSFRLNDSALFTGDTLFTDGVGRPDLKADQDEAMKRATLLYQSLKQILGLNPNTLVFPAHLSTAVPFDDMVIGKSLEELKASLAMLKLNEQDFINYTLSRIPLTPPNYLTIAGLNKQDSFEGYIPADLEAGANRCAIA